MIRFLTSFVLPIVILYVMILFTFWGQYLHPRDWEPPVRMAVAIVYFIAAGMTWTSPYWKNQHDPS